jgi:hypothetical protein
VPRTPRRLLTIGIVAAALAAPSAAAAATTIGSPLSKAPESSNCGAGAFTNTALGAGTLRAPYDGVVTGWRLDLKAAGGAFEYRLRILEPPAIGTKYTFVASGPPQKAPAVGINAIALPQPLPIKAGDIIAYDCPAGAPSAGILNGMPGSKMGFFAPPPADGAIIAPSNQLAGQEQLFNADVVGQPSLAAVAPATAPLAGGTAVTLSGTRLGEVTGVSFGGVAASAFTVLSETELRATAPPHAAGTVDVQVTNAAGASAVGPGAAFTYIGPPTVAGFGQSHASWRLGGKLATASKAKKAPRPPLGTVFSFSLDQAANVVLSFGRQAPGRKAKGACVAPSPTNQARAHCQRTLPQGALTVAGHVGSNRVSFQGRISAAKKLKPGAYAVTIVATNSIGEASRSKTLRFKIAG